MRLALPSAIKGLPDVQEFRKPTVTANLHRAKTIGAQFISEKRADWDKLLAAQTPSRNTVAVLTPELVEHLCTSLLYHWRHTLSPAHA